MSKSTHDAIVADVGETHTRLAVANYDRLSIDHYVQFDNGAFGSVSEILAAYVRSIPISPPAIGIAITNGQQTLDVAKLQHELAGQVDWGGTAPHVCVIEALDALALALPYFASHDTETIGGGKAEPRAPKAIISVGRALGVVSLTQTDDAWATHHTHAENIAFAPQTRQELDILERMRCDTDYVSVENLLSAAGLSHLYELLLENAGQAVRDLPASDIIDEALNENDMVAAKAVDDFTTWLGRFAGDVGLIYNACGGIYLWGPIPRRMERRLRADFFRAAFEAKGRRSSWLAQIPIFLIRSDDAILRGATIALARRLG